MDFPITTVCVSGGDFTLEHLDWFVRQLRPSIRRHVWCVTDYPDPLPEGVHRIGPYAPSKYPGWWQKVTGAMLGLEDTLYIDLDTVILNPNLTTIRRVIDENRHEVDAIVMRDWLWQGRINSSIMWLPCHVQDAIRDAAWHTNIHRFPEGDQQFLETLPFMRDAIRWDELTESIVPSYKQLKGQPIGKHKEIVSFSGKPRPWELPEQLLEKIYKR